MNKKIIYGIIVAIVILGISSFFLKFTSDFNSDPFGASPKEASLNCGPEDRYKFEVDINSKDDFANFIKNNQVNLGAWVRLDNFKDRPDGNVDWDKVLASITAEKISGKTIYVLNFNPTTCSGFTLKMTNNGYVSNYGCCGK